LNVVESHPTWRVKNHKCEPIFNHVPNVDGVSAIKEKVASVSSNSPTKRAYYTIMPPDGLKPVRRPHMVLYNEPIEKLEQGIPILPN
jgi:hypothetical protein